MSTEKWINDTVIVMSLVLIVGIVAMYIFESGGTESVIPVTGNQEIPITLCCSRTHEKVHPVIQHTQGEINESASPVLP